MSLELEQGNAKELFEACDLDSSGFIDRNELAAVVDLDPEDLKEIFAQLDKDDDGRISIEEFTENFNKNLASLVDKHSDSEPDGDNKNDLDLSNNVDDQKESKRPRPKRFTFDRGKGVNPEMKKKAKMLNG